MNIVRAFFPRLEHFFKMRQGRPPPPPSALITILQCYSFLVAKVVNKKCCGKQAFRVFLKKFLKVTSKEFYFFKIVVSQRATFLIQRLLKSQVVTNGFGLISSWQICRVGISKNTIFSGTASVPASVDHPVDYIIQDYCA